MEASTGTQGEPPHAVENFVLTKSELAARLRVKPRTVGKWMADGTLPFLRIGKRAVRFDWQAVRAALTRKGGVR